LEIICETRDTYNNQKLEAVDSFTEYAIKPDIIKFNSTRGWTLSFKFRHFEVTYILLQCSELRLTAVYNNTKPSNAYVRTRSDRVETLMCSIINIQVILKYYASFRHYKPPFPLMLPSPQAPVLRSKLAHGALKTVRCVTTYNMQLWLLLVFLKCHCRQLTIPSAAIFGESSWFDSNKVDDLRQTFAQRLHPNRPANMYCCLCYCRRDARSLSHVTATRGLVIELGYNGELMAIRRANSPATVCCDR